MIRISLIDLQPLLLLDPTLEEDKGVDERLLLMEGKEWYARREEREENRARIEWRRDMGEIERVRGLTRVRERESGGERV